MHEYRYRCLRVGHLRMVGSIPIERLKTLQQQRLPKLVGNARLPDRSTRSSSPQPHSPTPSNFSLQLTIMVATQPTARHIAFGSSPNNDFGFTRNHFRNCLATRTECRNSRCRSPRAPTTWAIVHGRGGVKAGTLLAWKSLDRCRVGARKVNIRVRSTAPSKDQNGEQPKVPPTPLSSPFLLDDTQQGVLNAMQNMAGTMQNKLITAQALLDEAIDAKVTLTVSFASHDTVSCVHLSNIVVSYYRLQIRF